VLGAARDVRSARAGRRGGYSDDLLRSVAEIYNANLAGGSPTKAVGAALHHKQSTAQLYVRKARDRGFITAPPPIRRGRPRS
jgi:transposase